MSKPDQDLRYAPMHRNSSTNSRNLGKATTNKTYGSQMSIPRLSSMSNDKLIMI